MEQPSNAQIVEMLREQQTRADEQQARVDEQQRCLAQQEARTTRLEADNLELKGENAELKVELERQRLEKISLTSRVNQVEGGPAPQDKKLSRAGLFKAAAMGSAAVVGAGALGTLGAEHAAAASTDTNFVANGTNVTNFRAAGTAAIGVDTNGLFETGVEALGTTTGVYASGGQYAARFNGGNGVPLYLYPTPTAGPPTTGTHNNGEFNIDTTGRIYHCVTDGTPGTWVPLNALIPISPVRVMDTRIHGTLTGPFPTGTTLNLSLAGQTFTTSSGAFTFPGTVVGVVGNLVAVTPTGAGYLVAYPQGATLPTAASVNFVPPGTGADIYYAIGNNVTVALSASGQLSIYIGMVAGATVQVVLDIAGYLV